MSLRTSQGGRIDRTRTLRFRFDGRDYTGHPGDTLASALLANGVRVTGRSFKYHRPRGLMGAGCEEPNTLVQLGSGDRTEPNLKATQVELFDGLEARAVNCSPSARWDWLAPIQWLKPFMPAGFYYKTFIAPNWHWYEGSIRRAAGLGKSPVARDPDAYDKRFTQCDVLVVGAGPAGIAAALDAAKGGRRVLLLDDKPEPGGSLLYESADAALLERRTRELGESGVELMCRTTAFGYYDHDHVVAHEQLTDHAPGTSGPRQRLWKIRAGEVVLATGALERPLAFPNNDRPGVMLAGAARHYLRRFGVLPGRRVVLATNNSGAYEAALELRSAGVEIVAIADLRASPSGSEVVRAREANIEILAGHAPTGTRGAHGLRAVELHRVDAQGRAQPGTRVRLDADTLLVSGGWNPTVHLFSQSGGSLRFDEALQTFVPASGPQRARCAGGAAGWTPESAQPAVWEIDVTALGRDGGKTWVDFLSDVTASDLRVALRENFRSVEHIKRYTTTGMAPDQGKTSNVIAIGIAGRVLDKAPQAVGTTRFRPPFNPVTFGAVAGRRRGAFFRPLRHLPAEESHLALGAQLEDYGGWLRPAFYAKAGEDEHRAVAREALAVRTGVGAFDGSPLGKLLVHGPDAAEFLHRIYANNILSLKPGRCRYGVMLGEDGVIFDDGICTRLAEDRFLVGTTSGNAGRVLDWLEEWLQCEWVDLDVTVEQTTTQWAVVTLTGPKAREVLQRLDLEIDVSAQAFPHMSFRETRYAGLPLRIHRVSFTGELSYEISVPASAGRAFWDRVLELGAPLGVVPFGIETMMVLRTEKGFLHVGTETDGCTFPQDVGLGAIVEQKKGDFAGRRSTLTPEGRRTGRRQLVGLRALDDSPLPVGGHVIDTAAPVTPCLTQGWVTSAAHSPALSRPVALAMVADGRARLGQTVHVIDGGKPIAARVVEPCAYDPKGERLDG